MSQDQDTLKYFNEKMKFMRFLDHARWCNHSFLNYELPNMADKKAPSEQVLLTHFLGYITNRQTPFQTVFEQLDYIFSQMVHNFAKGESVDDLLNPCKDKSFFVQKEGKDTYTFVSHEAKSEDSSCPEITKGLMRKPGDRIYAVSRFYPNDYIAIRCVMEILDEGIHGHPFNRGLIDFIKWAIGDKPAENGLERLLYALWLLGYQGIGSWAATKPDKEKHDGKTSKGYLSDFFGESESDSFNLFRELKNKKKEYLEDMGKNGLNDAFYKKNFARAEKSEDIKDNERFSAKRVICFVRDMFKLNSNAFSTYLKKE